MAALGKFVGWLSEWDERCARATRFRGSDDDWKAEGDQQLQLRSAPGP